MAFTQIPNSLRRILNMSSLLIFVSTFAIFFMGNSLSRVHDNIKYLDKFLVEARDVQPNFEESLTLYTEKTEGIIKNIAATRPVTEKELVQFISTVEGIGQKLDLQIDLQSFGNAVFTETAGEQKSIQYKVSFYGGLE